MKKILSIGTALVITATSVLGLSGCGQSNMVQEISYTATENSDILNKCEFEGEIKNGTKLIVAENQLLVIFKDGKAVKSFTAGEHVISNENSDKFVSSEVYFLDITPQENIKWGISDPILYMDPAFGDIELLCLGEYSYSFDNPVYFVESYLNNNFDGTAAAYILNTVKETVKNTIVAESGNSSGNLISILKEDNINKKLPDNGADIKILSASVKYTEESATKIRKYYSDLLNHSESENTVPTEATITETTTSPQTIVPHTTAPTTVSGETITFKADVHLKSKEEDGRHTPIFTNYKPELVIYEEKFMATCKSLDGKEMVMPGEDVVITFEITSTMKINKGDEITLREGGRVIGTGVVTEIL